MLVQVADELHKQKGSPSEFAEFLHLPLDSLNLIDVSKLNIRGLKARQFAIEGLLSDVVNEKNNQHNKLDGLYKGISGRKNRIS